MKYEEAPRGAAPLDGDPTDIFEPDQPTEHLPFFPYHFMSIDVGSNAIKYNVWTIEESGSMRQLNERRYPVRLGHGTFTTGLMSEETMAEAVEAFKSIRQDIQSIGVHAYRAVGTSAMREASNSLTLVRRVAEAADIQLEILPAAEEARAIALGVLGTRPNLQSPHLLIDIGGGSTEVILTRDVDIVFAQSMRLGAVRISETFFTTSPPSDEEFDLARVHVRDVLGKVLRASEPQGDLVCLGSAGTITTLAEMATRLPSSGAARPENTLSTEDVGRIVEKLRRLSEKVTKEFKIDPRRAEILLAGALVLHETLRHMKVATLGLVRGGGVSEGLLQNFLERYGLRRSRLFDHDRAFLIQAVAVGEHYRFNRFHARQVSTLATSLFDQLTSLHELDADDRRLLKGAALLHEIGQFISFAEHHKHSYYLILHSDLPGLSASEKMIMALVARYHRKAHPNLKHEGFGALDLASRDRVRKLAAILRIADALDREHQSLVSEARVTIGPKHVQFDVLTNYEAPIEIWNAGQKGALFEEVFHRTPRFALRHV